MPIKYSIPQVLLVIIGVLLTATMVKNMLHPTSEITAQKAVAAFLCVPKDAIICTRMTGGYAEATLYKATHQEQHYIVKIFPSNEMALHEIEWTEFADQLGIGPKMYCSDRTQNLFIMEQVPGNSLHPNIAKDHRILQEIARKLRILHSASMPDVTTQPLFLRITEKYQRLSTQGDLQNLVTEVWYHALTINAALEKTSVPTAPCHNDLNPRNIFVRPDASVTIIDWGDAATGNPLYDIAIFLVLNDISQESEQQFLETYNTALITPLWHQYLEQLKQLVRLEFALNLLGGVQEQQPTLLQQPDIPSTEPLQHYLTLFAEHAPLENDFIYRMGLAALQEYMHYSR